MIDPAAILSLLSEKQIEIVRLRQQLLEAEAENARLRGAATEPTTPA